MIEHIREIIKSYNYLDLATSGENYPTFTPMVYFYNHGIIVMTTSVVFSEKLMNINNNPKVSLMIKSSGYKIIIQGIAELDERNLETGWERYRKLWFSLDRLAADSYSKRDMSPYFWKRVIIKVIPNKIIAEKDGEKYIIKMEVH